MKVEYKVLNGPVVELVDALDSKSSIRKNVGVRFSPGPPVVILLKRSHREISYAHTVKKETIDDGFLLIHLKQN